MAGRVDRELDGIYWWVERDGKKETVSFSDMTQEEMQKVLKGKDPALLTSLCIALGQRIREIGDRYDLKKEP